MDAEYLKSNVGEVLANGLTAVVLNQPEDSVDFLGRWLLNYVQSAKAVSDAQAEAARNKLADDAALAKKKAADETAARKKEEVDRTLADNTRDLENFLLQAKTFEGLQVTYYTHTLLYTNTHTHLHIYTHTTGRICSTAFKVSQHKRCVHWTKRKN
jgi:hypothetical protein